MSKSLIYIKPAPGARVRHEVTRQPLPESGAYWQETPYVRRRLRDGDVVKAAPPAPASIAPQAAPAAAAKVQAPRKSTSKQKKD